MQDETIAARDRAALAAECERLAAALYRAEVALSRIRTPGAVALTSHKNVDKPYVRDVAEVAMNDAAAERHRWEAMQRRLRSAS